MSNHRLSGRWCWLCGWVLVGFGGGCPQVVSMVGSEAVLGFGLEMHLSLGWCGCDSVAASSFGLEVHPSLVSGCFGSAAECSPGLEVHPPLGWSHVGSAARL